MTASSTLWPSAASASASSERRTSADSSSGRKRCSPSRVSRSVPIQRLKWAMLSPGWLTSRSRAAWPTSTAPSATLTTEGVNSWPCGLGKSSGPLAVCMPIDECVVPKSMPTIIPDCLFWLVVDCRQAFLLLEPRPWRAGKGAASRNATRVEWRLAGLQAGVALRADCESPAP
ncbi:hypothetical protein D3C71_1280310 [compost metagenome]